MHKYRVNHFIGEGSFSEVYSATDLDDGNIYAMKLLKHRLRSREEFLGLSEVCALQQLQGHPHIIELHDLFFHSNRGAMILERMDTNLHDYIHSATDYLPDGLIIRWVYQLFDALTFIHSKGLFHRDIKPENILITGKVLKIADLGSCGSIANAKPHTQYVSTRWYRPPECIITSGFYTNKMDIWAAACVIFELVTFQPLFPGANSIDQINLIHKVLGTPNQDRLRRMTSSSLEGRGGITFPNIVGSGLGALIEGHSDNFQRVLEKLLIYEPHQRPSANTVWRVILPFHFHTESPTDTLDADHCEIRSGGVNATIARGLKVYLPHFKPKLFRQGRPSRKSNSPAINKSRCRESVAAQNVIELPHREHKAFVTGRFRRSLSLCSLK